MKKKFFKSYVFFIICIVLPSLIISSFSIINNVMNLNKLTKNTSQSATQTMFSAYQHCKSNLNSLSNTANIFAAIPSVRQSLTDTALIFSEDTALNLKNLLDTNPYIINAFIIDTKQGNVLHSDGLTALQDYFANSMVYKNYSPTYWSNFTFYHSEPYRILSPSHATIEEQPYSVIPIVYRIAGTSYQKRILVFNVNLNALLSVDEINTYNTTQYFMINKFTKELFSLSSSYEIDDINDIEFCNALLNNPNADFSYRLFGKKLLVTTSSENDSMLGYTMVAVTPERDVFHDVFTYSLTLIAINIVLLIIVLLYSFHNVNTIFKPIKNTYIKLSDEVAVPSNILSDIEDLAEKVKSDNNNLIKILPYAQEKYLVNLLNNLEFYNENKQSDDILKNSLDFKYHYFSVILLQLSPSTSFFDRFSIQDYETIKVGFYNIICELFSKSFDSYVLPAQNNVLNIILNYDKDNNNISESIRETLKTIFSLLQADFEYVTLSIGSSSTHSDLSGLKHAHEEALSNFIPYNTPSENPTVDMSVENTILYSTIDETNIYSALSSYDKEKILNEIEQLFEKNSNLSTREQKILYNYILNTILKFLHINKIPYMDEMLDFEIANKFLSQPLPQIKTYLDELIDYIAVSKKMNNDFEEIYAYIKTNCYAYDMSLKQLSDVFSLSQPSLTRIIQANVGMPFKQLVNSLRIEKAKDLIENTELSIEEIYELVGFSNKQTFFRVFKAVTGVTPGDYKKNMQTKQ